MADDKNAICQIAKRIGVPTPFTTSISEHENVAAMADSVRFPCIIKYRNGELMGKKPKERYTVVHDRDAFIRAYTEMQMEDENPIASDYISGHDLGVAVVMNRMHEPVSFLCYESLREYPIQGGPTCYLRTIYSPRMVEYSIRLLQEIGFTGIAMLDFKGTPDNPYFLEINPRLWGSAAITYLSGCDFFESYVLAATEDTPGQTIDKLEMTVVQALRSHVTPLQAKRNSWVSSLQTHRAKTLLQVFVHLCPLHRWLKNSLLLSRSSRKFARYSKTTTTTCRTWNSR